MGEAVGDAVAVAVAAGVADGVVLGVVVEPASQPEAAITPPRSRASVRLTLALTIGGRETFSLVGEV